MKPRPSLPPEDCYATRKKIEYILHSLAQYRIKLGRPLHILDFGCGNATQLGQYVINDTDFYTGIDIHGPSLAYARDHFGGPTARFLDAIPPDETFDILIVSEVLEHLDAPGALLAATVTHHLRSHGIVFGSIPHGYGLTEIEKYIDQKLHLYPMFRAIFRFMHRVMKRNAPRVLNQPPYNYNSGHVQFFTRKQLQAVAAEAGLELAELRNGSLMGADLSGATILRPRFMIRLNTWIADYLPSWAAATWFFRLEFRQKEQR